MKFTYLTDKARAAMHAAGVSKERKMDFFPEVVMTMTKLDWLTLGTIKGTKKIKIEHYNLPLPRFFEYLRTLGEARTVKTGKDKKTGDRGVTCMFVGYTSNQEGDWYRIRNPKTKKVSKTRDIVFLNRM